MKHSLIPLPTRHQIHPKQRIPLDRLKRRPSLMFPPPFPPEQRHLWKERLPTRAIRLEEHEETGRPVEALL